MAKRIEITLKHDGSVEVEVSGVKGNDCHALTRELERGLGVVVKDTEKKESEVKRHETIASQN